MSSTFIGENVHLDEFDEAEALRDLARSELILVRLPEAAATDVVRMVADAVTFKADVRVAHLLLQPSEVECRVWSVNAGRAHAALDLEGVAHGRSEMGPAPGNHPRAEPAGGAR